jgi:hypothetical protein
MRGDEEVRGRKRKEEAGRGREWKEEGEKRRREMKCRKGEIGREGTERNSVEVGII